MCTVCCITYQLWCALFKTDENFITSRGEFLMKHLWYLPTIVLLFSLCYILSLLLYRKVDLQWDIVPVKTSACSGYEFEVEGNFTELLAKDKPFRVQLAQVILQSADDIGKSASIYWECTPISVAEPDKRADKVADDKVRFCVTRATVLEGASPDYYTFSEHFKLARSGEKAVTFPNLGRDAMLVAPIPEKHKNFACLATWLRETRNDEESWDKLFEAVGKAVMARVEEKSSKTIWISTNGAGVSWLHFRIDSYPKYYTNWQYVAMKDK